MTSGLRGSALAGLRRLLGGGTLTGVSEDRLLERFLSEGDEAAFGALLDRHGPMVLGVCRRQLSHPHDVEDAFQATFLVLLRKAHSIRDHEVLGTWLYRVASRVAVRARIEGRRRRSREVPTADALVAADHNPGRPEAAELRAVLDEEVGRLAERYRSPFVLCDLEGQSYEEAAAQLRCPVGTVKSRLSRARAELRSRLDRRGVAPSAGILVPALSRSLADAVPADLRASTLAAALQYSAGSVPAAVAELVDGTIRSMSMSGTLKLTAAALSAALIIATGAGVFAFQATHDRAPGDAGPSSKTRSQSGAAPQKTVPTRPAPGSDPKSRAVLAKLDEPISMHFAQPTPFEDVIKYVQAATAGPNGQGAQIYVDPVGLEMQQKTMTSPITLTLDGIPLRQTLKLIADQMEMCYGIKDGMIIFFAPDYPRQNWRELLLVDHSLPEVSPLQDEVERAVRGELTLTELHELNERLKAVEEATKLFNSIRTNKHFPLGLPMVGKNPQ